MSRKALLSEIHPAGKLIFLLIVSFVSIFIIIVIGVLLAMLVTGHGLFEVFGDGFDMTAPENLGFGKYLQILSHLGMFIIPGFLLAFFFSSRISNYLFLDKRPGIQTMILSVVLVFVSVPLINYLLELNMQMHFPEKMKFLEDMLRSSEDSAEKVTKAFLSVDTIQGLIFNLFMIAVIPAIGEEFIFRGVLMRIVKEWTGKVHLTVWITAIVFSAIHMQFFGFLPRVILGVLFGYLVVWSGSLWPAMLAHFANNAAAVIFFYLNKHNLTDTSIVDLGKGGDGLYYGLISLVLICIVLYGVRRLSLKRNIENTDPGLSG